MKILSKLTSRLSNLYWHYMVSPISYAQHIGVKIGENCMIASKGFSTEPYLIEIGNNVQITKGVMLHTHGGGNSVRMKYPDFDAFGKIRIRDWAYIGAYSQIMPGVTIGEGAIVAAGSIVTKSVLPHTVVGGNPAHYICSVDEYLKRNLPYNTGTKGMNKTNKKAYLLSLPDEKFITK